VTKLCYYNYHSSELYLLFVFYIKHMMDNVRTSQETHYVSTTGPKRLMRSTGLRRWYINVTIIFPVIIHRHVLYIKHTTDNVRTSQETYYLSATESSRLIVCKIWDFDGSDYEEWRLLGYKHPVRTSQKTHYVSDTELSLLMLCKIWGFHDSDYEECLFWDIKTLLVPHRRHITSPLQSPAG
jgi:hypothetical protein